MTAQDKEILVAFAENGMKCSRTADAVFLHHNSVEYHLRKIKKETGLDPRNLYDLIKLLEADKPPAQWLINPDGWYPYCSNCNGEPKSGEMSKYCPYCGAKMEKNQWGKCI